MRLIDLEGVKVSLCLAHRNAPQEFDARCLNLGKMFLECTTSQIQGKNTGYSTSVHATNLLCGHLSYPLRFIELHCRQFEENEQATFEPTFLILLDLTSSVTVEVRLHTDHLNFFIPMNQTKPIHVTGITYYLIDSPHARQ